MAVTNLGWFRRMSLNARVWLVVSVVAIGLVSLTVLSAVESRAVQMRDLQTMLRHQVGSAAEVAKQFHQRAVNGEFDQKEAQHRALSAISAMRWSDGKGYVFAFDSNLVMKMYPPVPGRVGEVMSDDTSANGKNLYKSIVDADRADGFGFTRYMLKMPDGKTSKDKISYSQWYRPWDLHFAAGAYFEDIDAQFYRQLRVSLLRAAGVALFVLLVVWLSIRSIRNSLGGEPSYAVDMATRIAGGDLVTVGDVRTAPKGSLIEALLQMRERLTSIVTDVQRGAQTVSTASEEISRGNDDLSQRTQEQASSLEETAASMEEMSSTVKQNTENVVQADRLARDARNQAKVGVDVVGRAASAMDEINESSRKISDIVGLIDEIAFQTNLLSLNAAVEAARAGEQGRGFAVVASEVRALAQRSATAAREIKALIQESVARVEAGSGLVGQSSEMLQEIVAAVESVTAVMAEIAAASQEQSNGIDEVNRAVMQMDDVTQQNAALVEQSAAAARAMQEQAQQLTRQVAYFRTTETTVAEVPRTPVRPQMKPARPPVRPAAVHATPVQQAVTASDQVWAEF